MWVGSNFRVFEENGVLVSVLCWDLFRRRYVVRKFFSFY